MSARLANERRFHDKQAKSRALTFAREPHRLRFTDDEYLDHESWVRSAFEKLGDVRGKQVLDYGCGHGMAAVVLARRGAIVTACDLAPGYVAEAKRRAQANGVRINCTAADCEHLPFAEASFDAIWGHAILHHLDVPTAGRELARVLKPGGVIVLCEPWSGNPIVEAVRRWRPYAGKHRTADEKPLGPLPVAQLRAVFAEVAIDGRQLFGMFHRGRAFERLDQRLLSTAPSLARWCRYSVLTLRIGNG